MREIHDAIEDDAALGPIFARADMRSQSAEQAHFLELAMTDDTEAESAHPRHPPVLLDWRRRARRLALGMCGCTAWSLQQGPHRGGRSSRWCRREGLLGPGGLACGCFWCITRLRREVYAVTLHAHARCTRAPRRARSKFQRARGCAAKAWHKKHLEDLKAQGLTPALFQRYLELFRATMADLQLPETRIAAAANFMEAAW